jgi:tyrosyl-tRNA synthetase
MNTTLPSILTRGVAEVLPSAAALADVMTQKKIRLYLGIDPTSNKLHLGHSVVLRKLQEFADAGHEVILLIGNGTVKIGDPTGRDKTRPVLTDQEIETNFATWKQQAEKILDFSKITIRRNGDWLDKLSFADLVHIMSKMSVQQLLERDMFQERIKNGLPIFVHELIYPLAQGYDSVVMDVDLELGGTDQTFNMLMGRQLQKLMNNREKFVLSVPLLLGTDGRKMGKSLGNFIGMTETPEDMYGKLMAITDAIIINYYTLLTDIPAVEIADMERGLANGSAHPMELKKKLAFTITKQYHGEALAQAAQEHFEKTVQKKEVPTDLPEIIVTIPLLSALDLVMLTNTQPSRSAATRLIEQGGVELDGQKLTDWKAMISINTGAVLRVGKRQYFRLS